MFQDSVPAGSYNDPFLSSVCVPVCVRACMRACVRACVGVCVCVVCVYVLCMAPVLPKTVVPRPQKMVLDGLGNSTL